MHGCLKEPYYQYGFTDEKEFAQEIETSKVQIAMADTGTVVQIAKTKDYRNQVERIDDEDLYWRSAFIKYQNTCADLYNYIMF